MCNVKRTAVLQCMYGYTQFTTRIARLIYKMFTLTKQTFHYILNTYTCNILTYCTWTYTNKHKTFHSKYIPSIPCTITPWLHDTIVHITDNTNTVWRWVTAFTFQLLENNMLMILTEYEAPKENTNLKSPSPVQNVQMILKHWFYPISRQQVLNIWLSFIHLSSGARPEHIPDKREDLQHLPYPWVSLLAIRLATCLPTYLSVWIPTAHKDGRCIALFPLSASMICRNI